MWCERDDDDDGLIKYLAFTCSVGTAKFPWIVYAWPLAKMTGPFTCGFGRYGMVAPLGGLCENEKIYKYFQISWGWHKNKVNYLIMTAFFTL